MTNSPAISPTLTVDAAASELLARRMARISLIEFAKYTNPIYEVAPHHKLICDALERVLSGECKRLMITMPPRHGKSELASRRFPSYAMGRYPQKQIIAASYNSDLASDFGREVRNIVDSPEFHNLFPDTSLSADSKAANRWHTNKGGMYVAAGVGTAITGRGADILLIDDPFKDRQEADSEITRQRVWDWYTSTAYTRLMPGGAVVVINTRWHDDDLSGKLLAEADRGGDKWEVLSLPAIKDGNALWPEWYPLERLEQIRSVLPARDWNALYQQNPIPDDGDYFKAAWFGEYDELPPNLRMYGASDYAVTDGGGDFTEHGVVGVDGSNNIYIVDWWKGQTTSDVWIDAKCDLIIKHSPHCWFGESGPIRRAVEPFMMRRMQEREAYCRIEWLASISDKPSRARPIQALASMGKVFFPKNAVWKSELMIQILRFPAAKHDDGVDVLSLFGRGMEFIRPPKSRKVTSQRIVSSMESGSWMGM